MLELITTCAPKKPSDLFNIDWQEGIGATKVYDQVNRAAFSLINNAAVINDPVMGLCLNANDSGVIQDVVASDLIDFTLPKWELSIAATTSAERNSVLITKINNADDGGWSLTLASSGSRLMTFRWKDAANKWRSLTATTQLTTTFMLRLVRDGPMLAMYSGDTIIAITYQNVTFNSLSALIAIGRWNAYATIYPWYGNIGQIRFFVPQ